MRILTFPFIWFCLATIGVCVLCAPASVGALFYFAEIKSALSLDAVFINYSAKFLKGMMSMKKFVALILAAIMSLSFVACGDRNLYEVGNTVSTDSAQLTLESCEFADTYNGIGMGEGKVFAVLTFSVKNIGKTKLGFIKTINDKKDSLMFSAMPCIDYNDGYLFSYDDMLGQLDLCSTDKVLSDLEPLSDSITVEVAIAVPSEVEESEDKPLNVKMAVPTAKGTEVFTYKIR